MTSHHPEVIRSCGGSSQRRLRRRWSCGNAIIETVLVLSFVLIPLTFGMTEFGYFFYVKHSLAGAAREGARAAIVPGAQTSEVTSAIAFSMTQAGLSGSGYSTNINPPNFSALSPGQPITVTIACTWGAVGGGFRMLGPLSMPVNKQVKGVTVMRKE